MNVALLALTLFTAAFLLHVIVWRLRPPKRQIFSLLLLFMSVLVVGMIGVLFCRFDFGIWQLVHAAISYTAVALAYIVLFSALEEDSPTLSLLLFLADAGPQGRSVEEVHGLLSADLIVGSRFHGLTRSGLICQVGSVHQLTGKGRVWAQLFRWFRVLFGMRKGG